MCFIFFLALLMASTVNGLNFTDTDGTAPITSIARASKTKSIDSNNKVNRLRGPQKPEDEERFDAAGFLLDSDDESTTSKNRKDEKASHKVDKMPLSPKAAMWASAISILLTVGITAGAAFGLTKLMQVANEK
ncbi:hypothetical protein PC129_g16777 [Phytophthora cactorum]|uniref:RxLR effector protein n=1 Tax=Phytophthora cactorum TaxID=29920 RepID=A0A329RGP0_9STRA|nr:hypothetical protein Pcac1_g13271 [Phytophthora cactorum]KAG2799112.1 hypothetical protein PC111_g20559 [Phytophthora cactorum]KAG2802930.1 hypothetical protein PC112_g19419 [Phytophthora cactorum]KAG2851392.1 hypothetical protein PC113_g15963 [Phytophthora cactorum]KAG2887584.1 hypothetical protein PC114_g18776 [Phytophthora cactorum]